MDRRIREATFIGKEQSEFISGWGNKWAICSETLKKIAHGNPERSAQYIHRPEGMHTIECQASKSGGA